MNPTAFPFMVPYMRVLGIAHMKTLPWSVDVTVSWRLSPVSRITPGKEASDPSVDFRTKSGWLAWELLAERVPPRAIPGRKLRSGLDHLDTTVEIPKGPCSYKVYTWVLKYLYGNPSGH